LNLPEQAAIQTCFNHLESISEKGFCRHSIPFGPKEKINRIKKLVNGSVKVNSLVIITEGEEQKPLKCGNNEGEIFRIQISFFERNFTAFSKTLQQMRQNPILSIINCFIC